MMTEAGNRALLLLVTTTYFIWGAAAQVQSDQCPATCVARTCEDPENNNLICTHGCVDGYWGDRCYNKCPVNCAICHRHFGWSGGSRECYTCKHGFYTTGTDTECSLACLPQCRACNNESDCTACTDGYYLDNAQCQSCPPRCTQCTSDNVCTECASEHYTGVVCEECVDGRLGDMCESVQSNLCPETCVDRTCQDPENNNLTCAYGCVDGYWGRRCYNECPVTCVDRACQYLENKLICTHGCVGGYWGAKCANECPVTCVDRVCQDPENKLICTHGCVGGYWGAKCANECPVTCVDRACQDPENKLICTHGCVGGYWGAKCANECPVTCVDRACQDPENKLICTHGCVDSYWGNGCYNECPENCATCHGQFGATTGKRECYTCKDGFYITHIDTECTLACLPQCRACNSESNCTACTDGYYLDNAQCQPCPPRCTQCTSDNVCTECASEYYTGVVCGECVDGRYGDMCESVQSNLCPETCVERTCENNTQRRCTYGCVDGFWGTKCQDECPSRCAQCHRQFGDKRECYECQKGYYVTDTYTECTLSCHPQCESCTAADICQSCNHGYYNSEAVTNCSLTTPPCPSNCESCLSETECTTATDADDSIDAGTIAGLAVGGTVGLAVVAMFIVIIVLMYRRSEQARGQERRAEHVTETPRNIYDDLKMAGSTSTNGEYDNIDPGYRTHDNIDPGYRTHDNEPRTDDAIRPEYINMA